MSYGNFRYGEVWHDKSDDEIVMYVIDDQWLVLDKGNSTRVERSDVRRGWATGDTPSDPSPDGWEKVE